jgi:uncharacterized protein YaeQ
VKIFDRYFKQLQINSESGDMALKATVYRAELEISDIDRGYYASHSLTLARHPSETEQRLMVRLLAFALFADEALTFGKGISTDDEPDLWLRDDTGRIRHWIELGLPDERRLRRAAGRADAVTLLAYGERAFGLWREKNAAELARLDRLRLLSLSDAEATALEQLADRNLRLTCTIQDGQVWLGDATRTVTVAPRVVQAPRGAS